MQGSGGGREGDGCSCVFSLELSFEGLAHFLPLGRTLEAVGRLVAESIDSSIIVPSVSRCLVGLMIPSDSSLVGLYQCRLTIQIMLTCGSARTLWFI